MKSTTSPRPNPGDLVSLSIKLPTTPPRATPKSTDQERVSMLLEYHNIAKAAIAEIIAKTEVAPNPIEKAAESLKTKFSLTTSPSSETDFPGCRFSIASALVN